MIGIAYTKANIPGLAICDSLCEGIRKHGQKVLPIKSVCDYSSYSTIIQLCPYNPMGGTQKEIALRKDIYDNFKGNLLIIDSGFFSGCNKRWTQDVDDRYFAVGLGGIKGGAKYFNEDKGEDSTRWDKLGIKLAERKYNEGGYYLILGQHERGISTNHIKGGFLHWVNTTINYYLENYSRNVMFRPHPNQRELPYSRCGLEISEKGIPIEEDIKGAYAVIAATTNASTDAIINGIPLICEDRMNVAFNMARLPGEDLYFPSANDRQEWLNELSWAQWSIEEMRSGLTWEFWKDKV